MPLDPLVVRRRATGEFAALSVLVYLAAVVLLAVPATFLATGVQALGAVAGWWAGDPEAKGGEELVGPVVGVVSAVIVIAAAAAIVRHFGRRYQRPTAVPIVAGTTVILLGIVAVCVAVVGA